MPKRANATSFGGSKGNRPGRKKGDPTNVGAMPEVFRRRMQILASRAAEAKRLERLLSDENADDELFLKAFDRVCDRGYGKAPQSVDVTSDGEKIQSLLVVPEEHAP